MGKEWMEGVVTMVAEGGGGAEGGDWLSNTLYTAGQQANDLVQLQLSGSLSATRFHHHHPLCMLLPFSIPTSSSSSIHKSEIQGLATMGKKKKKTPTDSTSSFCLNCCNC
jgi:hypothetical protein